jgi:hypothetical protein
VFWAADEDDVVRNIFDGGFGTGLTLLLLLLLVFPAAPALDMSVVTIG